MTGSCDYRGYLRLRRAEGGGRLAVACCRKPSWDSNDVISNLTPREVKVLNVIRRAEF